MRKNAFPKLVLLPGMHGTTHLFEAFVDALVAIDDIDVYPIQLPSAGNQNYITLYQEIKDQIPSEPFVLLVESFSGGFVPKLLEDNPHIIGLVMAASFLENPRPRLSKITHLFLWARSFSPFIQCFGLGVTGRVQLLKSELAQVSAEVLSQRMNALNTPFIMTRLSSVRLLYIRGTRDVFVSKKSVNRTLRWFASFDIDDVKAGHFVLQAAPEYCAKSVYKYIKKLIL